MTEPLPHNEAKHQAQHASMSTARPGAGQCSGPAPEGDGEQPKGFMAVVHTLMMDNKPKAELSLRGIKLLCNEPPQLPLSCVDAAKVRGCSPCFCMFA